MLMNRTQVEVRFTDKLDSIRVDQREMEIPNAIKEKPIKEWFEATIGRVKWGGLGAEIKDMDFSGEKNAAYSFLFNGPEDKKREFMICVQSHGLGEEAQQESKKETVQEYLKDAENLHQTGNEEAAFLRYKIAAEEYGDAQAQYELARRYQEGNGVEPNEQKAIEWYSKAGQNGSLEAQLEMIRRCENGIGMEKSRTEAVVWCREAAKQGNVDAQYQLAECYFRGDGIEQDKEEAVKWYQEAAKQGKVDAQYQLAECYFEGDGVERDKKEAIKWYGEAAEQGHAEVQYKLAELYETGDEIEKSEKKAVELY